MTQSSELRKRFVSALCKELHVVWPILSGLVIAQRALGMLVGYLEGWRMSDAAYFTFVTDSPSDMATLSRCVSARA